MDNNTSREINNIFQQLLDEYFALRELHSDRSQETLEKIHEEYDEWVERFKEVQ